jgi:hypothetical protein
MDMHRMNCVPHHGGINEKKFHELSKLDLRHMKTFTEPIFAIAVNVIDIVSFAEYVLEGEKRHIM